MQFSKHVFIYPYNIYEYSSFVHRFFSAEITIKDFFVYFNLTLLRQQRFILMESLHILA